MKKTYFVLFLLNILTVSAFASFEEKFQELNIKTINQYPNLLKPVKIAGEKNVYRFPSTVQLSNRSIFSFLSAAVSKGNIDAKYLSDDFSWELFPIKDMQPGWEYAYSPLYLPKYYSFSPYKWDKAKLYSDLASELNKSPWPKAGLMKNFDLIFDKKTPVYINDLMFSVDKDSVGIYGSNILGLTRFGLPIGTSNTNSAIHLSMSKISVKTLIHEYLHDKIRYDSSGFDPKHVIYNKTPLLGLGDTWNDNVIMAYKIREVIDQAYMDKDDKRSFFWWKPLANQGKFSSSYSFTKNNNETKETISKRDMWDLMQFLEEVIVRVVVEALYKDPETAIAKTLGEIDGLFELINGNPGSFKALNGFAHSFYGNHQEVSPQYIADEDAHSAINVKFTKQELEMINEIVEAAMVEIRKLYPEYSL